MRSDSLEINSRRRRWGIDGSDRCEGCFLNGLHVEETCEHLIMECSQYDTKRACLEREITEEIGVNRWQQAKDGEGGGMDILLNMNGERNKIVSITKTFISKV